MIPIVLHHGLLGFGNFSLGPIRYSYFHRIDRALSELGHPLIISRVHPTAGIETRARQLKETILRQLELLPGAKKVIVLGHSMGGLDARYMISKLDMDERVSALLTVTTPHRGSPYANWCLQNLGTKLRGAQLMKFLGIDMQAVADLTTDHCARFNETVPNVPCVKYFSVSAARARNKIPPFALHAHKIIYDAEGDNDALVSVKSSPWGTHLGTWPADHFHTINKRFLPEFGNGTGDIAPYYVKAVRQVVSAI